MHFYKGMKNLEANFEKISVNTEIMLHFSKIIGRISREKCSYIFYFLKFHFLINSIKIKILRNLFIFYTVSSIFLRNNNQLISNNYVKLREMKLRYILKQKMMKKKTIELKKPFPIEEYLGNYWKYHLTKILYRKEVITINWTNSFRFLVILLSSKRIKKNRHRKILNFQYWIYLKEFLDFYHNPINFSNNSLCLLLLENFKFLWVIGLVQIQKNKIKNIDNTNLRIWRKNYNNFLGFLGYDSSNNICEKSLSLRKHLYFKDENYRFWKKINIHSFFSCPVEKGSLHAKITALRCGHIFSLKTIVELREKTCSFCDYLLITGEYRLSVFIECPWCETIDETFGYLILSLDKYPSLNPLFLSESQVFEFLKPRD